ncbi:acyl--CoA ligase [Sphingomonas sp. HDW15A]|uniref:class I adenylate-forming enzyme family protein n=1 Tax=Sphingomonas sp. HDW15A TaxID=2714942 RepID=UPI00140DA507|nr:class I adenylate-forming enzyme family protein [Sphingomonas sp. HDW15A]QIK96770.1 acyl--CoA ligase [Sphingomonas sp. HDW15A]
MRSELDRKFDETLAEIIGPGGRLVIERDEFGRAYVANFPATLPLFFKTFCALNSSVEGVVAGEERLTFADLDRISDQLAHALASRGIAKGDRVGIAMRNCPSWIVGYMAILKAGAIAVLLNGWWEKNEFQQALELTAPKLILADGPRARRIAEAGSWSVAALPIEQPVQEAFAALIDGAHLDSPLPDVLPEDDATILFTSGSTGESKGALSTHRAVTTGVYAYSTGLMVLKEILIRQGSPPPSPRTLLSVPLFHVTGEVPVMLNSFVVARTMVLMPKWDAGEALRLIEKERLTYFVGVPTMSLELMNHPDRGRYDLSSLTDVTAGGAPRPISHVERLKKEFPNAQPALGYGLTETNAVGCSNFWGNYAAKPASTGRAQPPYVELAILGEGDRHLAVGERGEIAIRSAANIKCYWENRAATKAAFTADHYLRTGDIGYLDEDGYLFIVDRKKDIILRGGENISAAEVEAAIYSCEGIAEAAVFGAPDERLGEVPVAILHRRAGSAIDEAELREFLSSRIAAFKVPAQIHFSDDPLPRLGTGKIDRVALKEKFAT